MQKQNFNQFHLSDTMLATLKKMNFSQPTEVQAQSILPALEGKDLLVQAPTGTGKTAAFGIPMIENIDLSIPSQALVLCPTRELAMQTTKVLSQLSNSTKIKIASIYGGENITRQFAVLRKKPHIIVATPGRLLDHLKRKSIKLNHVRMLVLDEADRMLDMGFRDDLHEILSKTSENRQTMLFSATMSKEITQIAKQYQENPVKIFIAKNNAMADIQIQQFYAEVPEKDKFTQLVQVIKQQKEDDLSIVFVNTKSKADTVAKSLRKIGIPADSMHGDMRQREREKVMSQYRKKEIQVLVATDVASRGIDVKDIMAVVNYDLPKEQESYVHRIGRTGRAMQKGTAYSFACPSERRRMQSIAHGTKMKIDRMPLLESTDENYALLRAKPQNQRTQKNTSWKKKSYDSKKPQRNSNSAKRASNKSASSKKI